MNQIKYILLFPLLLVIGHVHAQFTNQLVFDFNKGAFVEGDYFEKGKIKPQPTGGFAVLKIININTFRWKVEIEGRSINYVTPIPSELQTIFRLSDQTGDRQKTEAAVNTIQKAAATMTSVKAQVDEKQPDGALSVAMAELVEACTEYVELVQKIAQIKFTRMELINLSKQKWESYSAMNEKRPSSLRYEDMKKTYEEFSEYYSKAASKYRIAQSEAEANVTKLKPNKPGLKQAEDQLMSIKDALKKIESSYGDVYQDNFLSLVQDVVVLQDAMDNPSYYEVVSPPIQIDGDYVDFNIKTTPTKMNDLMPYDFGKTFPVEIPAKGGLKVDFSVGPTFSFGSNARSDKYYFKPSDPINPKDSTLQKLDNKNAISPGIAALMHFYGRRGQNVNYGGLFGVGAGFQTVQDANLSFYLGGSVIFGKREKLMLNAGVSYLSVDRLRTDQFTEGNKYKTSKIKIENVTENVILPSFFFGISYNLTNKIEVK
jgi:hypothetical protein